MHFSYDLPAQTGNPCGSAEVRTPERFPPHTGEREPEREKL